MAKVEIVNSLFEEIQKKFRGEAHEVIDLIESLEDSPLKGKPIGIVGGMVIKEVRYKSFRFYFIIEGNKLKCFDKQSLTNMLIRFVRMSDKKDQQQTIDEIKKILTTLGPLGFD